MDSTWRLILDETRNAADNMAIDEAILWTCTHEDALPTFRVYGWSSPAISLGYLQRLDRQFLDLNYCRNNGVELVRRITGGKAVLHGHDVTFSIAVSRSHAKEGLGSVLDSHQRLMQGIVAGLRLLGISADLGSGERQTKATPTADCFAHVADCDVRSGIEKIAGAAQVRRWNGLLEQGSIPHLLPTVNTDDIFQRKTDRPLQYPSQGRLADIPRADVIRALTAGFAAQMRIELIPDSLSPAEVEMSAALSRDKYSCDDWTTRRTSTLH